MPRNLFLDRLAVCSWSLEPGNPEDLAARLQTIGIQRVQLALDPLREAPAAWGNAAAVLRQHDITIVSGMFRCLGEDYSTLETIRATGGLAPDNTWNRNWQNIQAALLLARQLGLKLLTFHAGFLPHDAADPKFAQLQERLAQVADLFQPHDLALGLETGQETADALRNFLRKLGHPNVGVNFDPANMILYDKGDPVAALRLLGPWVRQVHLKDARRTRAPGTWGREVVVGEGQVDWAAFFTALEDINFKGHLCFEREAGDQAVADIRTARGFVERILT
jgi:L-ribulose-5-phosphate 3-epimerase